MNETPPRRPHVLRSPPLQAGIIILPSAFTLGNLFFGVYALVAAARGDLTWAAWFVVFASFLDFADGRVARFTRTGSSFGAELDSLVDAISFGVAPAFILYQLYLKESTWGWILSFVFITAMVLRLARFNVEQAGEAKTHFHGLPSPSAGLILATFHPFSETPFFQAYLADLPWPQIMGMVTVIVSVLMVSHVPYALVPRIGLRTARGLFNTAVVMGGLFLAITVPRYYFFPVLVLYTTWGLVKSVLLGLWERLPERDPLLDREEREDEADDSRAEVRSLDYRDVAPDRFRKARRRARRGQGEPRAGGERGPGRGGENG
jgi:CDP-diacylglycerol--serine O-phosphatidyltransferase